MSYFPASPVQSTTRRRRARRIALLAAALSLSAGACGEPPTAPHSAPTKVNDEISSGTIGASRRQLFFLLRDIDRDAFQGTFDSSLSPEVTVCLWENGACQSRAVGPVTLTSNAPASLRVSAKRERYMFRWETSAAELQPDAIYRLIVRVGGLQLGYLDIATGQKQSDLRDVDKREFLPLRVGAPVRVEFRIEDGPAIPEGIPGRYESDPETCVDGCVVHATPWNYFSIVWAGVRLGDLGGYGEAEVGFLGTYDDPDPTVPPVPAPGTVDIPLSSNWSWRYDEEGYVEIWVDGMQWGHWSGGSGGNAVLAPLFGQFGILSVLHKVAGVTPMP